MVRGRVPGRIEIPRLENAAVTDASLQGELVPGIVALVELVGLKDAGAVRARGIEQGGIPLRLVKVRGESPGTAFQAGDRAVVILDDRRYDHGLLADDGNGVAHAGDVSGECRGGKQHSACGQSRKATKGS